MSMLSAQCDELRELADQLQEHSTFVGFGGTTNTDPLMHGAATLMREAADTIWELRGMVHKERAENAELREQLAKARDPQRIGGTADPESFVYAIEQLREFRWQHATNDEEAIPYINNVADAHERENAKLRKLVKRMHRHIKQTCDVCDEYYCSSWDEDNECCVFDVLARELGIEVE